MNGLESMSVYATKDISTEEDYPKNCEILSEEWRNGNVNKLKIGDRVQLKYLMNTDGKYNPLRFKNQIGTIIDTHKILSRKNEGVNFIINWDNEELNKNRYFWNPYQFIKIN